MPARAYIDVEWIHTNADYPTRLVSELDERRFEIRKLEFFLDGQVGFADGANHFLDTMLGLEVVPELAEINSQAEFRGKPISQEVFETLWQEFGPRPRE